MRQVTFHFFAYEYPIVPAPFVEKAILLSRVSFVGVHYWYIEIQLICKFILYYLTLVIRLFLLREFFKVPWDFLCAHITCK